MKNILFSLFFVSSLAFSQAAIFDGSTVRIQKPTLRIPENGSGGQVYNFAMPALAADVTLTWPNANSSGVLTNNGSGTLTWAAASSASIKRVKVAASCSASPCTIASQDNGAGGNWVSSITRVTDGEYVLNITGGVFSADPTCVITGIQGTGGPLPYWNGTQTSTSKPFKIQNVVLLSLIDSGFDIYCNGP